MTISTKANSAEVLKQKAAVFTNARRDFRAFHSYPDPKPATLEDAYRIQDYAIKNWEDTLAGWKVGRITGDWETQLGEDRLAGPVFSRVVHTFAGDELDMPVFADGFAAVEGEVTAILAQDAPEGKTDWSTEDALEMISALHFGVEIASSPFSGINDHGPLVTISDFGNNYGLILGEEIPNWRDIALDAWEFNTVINGEEVGRASPTGLPGGPVESVRFLLENTSRRGLHAKAGMKILTGAVTGVHQAYVGDTARVGFAGLSDITCRLTEAKA